MICIPSCVDWGETGSVRVRKSSYLSFLGRTLDLLVFVHFLSQAASLTTRLLRPPYLRFVFSDQVSDAFRGRPFYFKNLLSGPFKMRKWSLGSLTKSQFEKFLESLKIFFSPLTHRWRNDFESK